MATSGSGTSPEFELRSEAVCWSLCSAEGVVLAVPLGDKVSTEAMAAMLSTETWQVMGKWHHHQTLSALALRCFLETERKCHCLVFVLFGPVAQISQRDES